MSWTLFIAVYQAHPGSPGTPQVPPALQSTLTFKFATEALANAAGSKIMGTLGHSAGVGAFPCVFDNGEEGTAHNG